MKGHTTIALKEEVKKGLDELKITRRESYDEVIERLIKNRIDDEPLSKETLNDIKLALEDVKAGRVYTTNEARKRLGI